MIYIFVKLYRESQIEQWKRELENQEQRYVLTRLFEFTGISRL